MPKVLVSVSSCQYYENSGLNDPMRETWFPEAKSLGIDCVFFHGSGSASKEDVVVLPVEDRLFGLTEKAKAKARWAVEHGYDFVFSCFPDTYANAGRLMLSGFEKHDYLGNVFCHPGGTPFCQGGPGYFLSKKACEAIFSDPTTYLNDDCWVADTLIKSGIKPVHHSGFTAFGPGPLVSNYSVTNHLSTQPGGFTGNNMREEHTRWQESL